MPEEMSKEEMIQMNNKAAEKVLGEGARRMTALEQKTFDAFLEEDYLGASNGIAGAKLPLPLEDRQYPEHEKLIEHIMDLVAGNIEGAREVQHAREILDDILIDLTYLKNAIGTPEQYLKKGLL
jgi:hypothetical protein